MVFKKILTWWVYLMVIILVTCKMSDEWMGISEEERMDFDKIIMQMNAEQALRYYKVLIEGGMQSKFLRKSNLNPESGWGEVYECWWEKNIKREYRDGEVRINILLSLGLGRIVLFRVWPDKGYLVSDFSIIRTDIAFFFEKSTKIVRLN